MALEEQLLLEAAGNEVGKRDTVPANMKTKELSIA
jgi:hypothetical protein